MKRGYVLALLIAAAVASYAGTAAHDTGAQGPSEVLLRAMGDEMTRTVERMRLEGLDKPYFVAYSVLESRMLDLRASFGGLERPRASRRRILQAEVRAGGREFDDSHFVGLSTRNFKPMVTALPIEDSYDSLRSTIWALSDRAYKRAVERLARKRVYRESKNIQEVIPDLSEDPVVSSREVLRVPPFDRQAWESRIREISAVFREFPRVQSSSLQIVLRAQHFYFVDSEGRSFIRPVDRYEITIDASAQSDDGMAQSDRRDLTYAEIDRIPSLKRLKAVARELAQGVTAVAQAPKIESYLGPVLLEEQAAGEFLSQLLASGVSAPREIWVEQKWAEEYFKPGPLTGRLGLRVIAPMFDVYDDPTLEVFDGQPLIGHYNVDEQGIPSRRVQLVENGILTDVLMSRSPTPERKQSNGHGRGAFNTPAAAAIGNLIVEADETIPLERMRERLREEARAFGLDHGMLITRISREQSQEEGELLAAPVMVYRVDVDTGKRELVRDARFASVTLRALRDVIAASDEQVIYNFAKPVPFDPNSTLRASIVHPSLLLSEIELAETDRKPSRLPYLSHPHFD